ncbi:restriction endonuclease subunit S [Salegentibacter agarivorans]
MHHKHYAKNYLVILTLGLYLHPNHYAYILMKSKLIDLKHIITKDGLSSGYSVRGKISNNPNGEVRIVQLKDFNDDYTAIDDKCFRISAEKIKSKYYLKNGDILFTGKGANNFAIVYECQANIPTIASSALFVIKVDKEIANPNYVSWYINQNKVQNYFKTNETGTYVTSINKKTVEEIPVVLPPLQVQNKIAQITHLRLKEKQLNTEITDLKNKLITNQLLNLL